MWCDDGGSWMKILGIELDQWWAERSESGGVQRWELCGFDILISELRCWNEREMKALQKLSSSIIYVTTILYDKIRHDTLLTYWRKESEGAI